MCNEYERQMTREAYEAEFSRIGPDWEPLASNEAPVRVRPTDRAPIIRLALDGGAMLSDARWGFVPRSWHGPVKAWQAQLKGNPMTNARAEGLARSSAFGPSYQDRRCLVPAVAYVEYSGQRPDNPKLKQRWRFTVRGETRFAFPGVWDLAETADGLVESFALITSAPGPDAAPYHNRQPVILPAADWADWLTKGHGMAETFHGSPAGTLEAEPRAWTEPEGLL